MAAMAETWQNELAAFLRPRTVLVGVGNRLRGDDAFGPMLVERLRGRVSWPTWDSGETPENDIGRIASFEPRRTLVLDAVTWRAAPGRIGFFALEDIPLAGVSTHAISLRMFAELLSARAGCPVALLGVEPQDTGFASPISDGMARSLDRIAEYLMAADAHTIGAG